MSSSLPKAPPVVVPHEVDTGRRSGLPWYADLPIALFLLALEIVAGVVLVLVMFAEAVVNDLGNGDQHTPPMDMDGPLRTFATVVASCAVLIVVAAAFGRAWITVTTQAVAVVAACSVALTGAGYASGGVASTRAVQAELEAPILPSL
ncbi:hypothetical protein GCM10020221_10100 [Streptomyces thioluteus]|uniref:DUF6234 domain-containing protein n=1 Tax=Streptomyces thioluteus TaxID=66431 RepID=A0ABN3WI75_STRTU